MNKEQFEEFQRHAVNVSKAGVFFARLGGYRTAILLCQANILMLESVGEGDEPAIGELKAIIQTMEEKLKQTKKH